MGFESQELYHLSMLALSITCNFLGSPALLLSCLGYPSQGTQHWDLMQDRARGKIDQIEDYNTLPIIQI